MRTLTASNGVKVQFYSSGRELSIARYTSFQKHLAKSASIPDIVQTIERAKAFNNKGDSESSTIELDNALFRLNAVQNGISTLTPAFAIMCHQIGEKVVSDITDSGIEETLAMLSELDFTYATVEDQVFLLKKK